MGFSLEEVRKRIPGHQGWAYYFWSMANEATIFGNPMEPVGSYLNQEIKRLKR